MSLAGKVALVTGGAQRLGKAMGLAMAREGMRLALHYNSSEEQARATAAEAEALGVEAALFQGDLSTVPACERLIDEAVAHFGRLDLLILSASTFFATPLGEVREEDWDRLFSMNLKGPFFCAQRAAPHLRASRGQIITMVDTGVYMSWQTYTPYLLTKAGIDALTRQLAKELAPEVRVNGIAPGPVLLPEGSSPEFIARSERNTLLKRLGSAEEIARAALYLAKADYVTGVVIPVDGGQRWR